MVSSLPRLARIGAPVLASLCALALAGCSKSHGELVVDDTVGVTALRSPCPLFEVPEMTGDVTLLAPGRTDSNAIQAVAAITNLRHHCDDYLRLPKISNTVNFDVVARRTDTHGALHLDLPYFSVIQQGGATIVAKHVGTVGIDFADGQDRATGHAEATAQIDRNAAVLPEAMRARLMRKRKAGDADAAVDPLSQPDVKAALAKATFEMLIGFQLTDRQLAYNATR
jgi:hypothetical protein